jgi:hypothetical protein
VYFEADGSVSIVNESSAGETSDGIFIAVCEF